MQRKRKLLPLAAIFLAANLWGSTALAFAPVGPPTASLKTGQWSMSADYAKSEIDFDIKWSSDLASDIPMSIGKDVKTETYVGKYRYGFNDDWEICLIFGASETKGEIDTYDFKGGCNFNGGFGFKWTFLRDEILSWGLAYQMDWSMGDDNYTMDLSTYGYGTQRADADLESFDIFVAVGPTLQIIDGLSVYGGVAFYYYDADIRIDLYKTNITNGNVDEILLAGYGGASIDLDKTISLYAEYMYSKDVWAMGGGFVWRF